MNGGDDPTSVLRICCNELVIWVSIWVVEHYQKTQFILKLVVLCYTCTWNIALAQQ